MATVAIGWIMEIVGHDIRLWSGDSDLTFNSHVYRRGDFISLRHPSNEVGVPDRRMTASFAVTDSSLRAALLEDIGPAVVRGNFIYSSDNGATWEVAGNVFAGRLSNPRLTNAQYSVELEKYSGDIDRGRPVRWSHERQVKRGTGGDLAFEMSAKLASGIVTKFPN